MNFFVSQMLLAASTSYAFWVFFFALRYLYNHLEEPGKIKMILYLFIPFAICTRGRRSDNYLGFAIRAQIALAGFAAVYLLLLVLLVYTKNGF